MEQALGAWEYFWNLNADSLNKYSEARLNPTISTPELNAGKIFEARLNNCE
jgi:hypothetical protein